MTTRRVDSAFAGAVDHVASGDKYALKRTKFGLRGQPDAKKVLVEAEAAASVAKAEAALAEAKAQRDEAGLKLVKLQAKLEDLEGSTALELTVR